MKKDSELVIYEKEGLLVTESLRPVWAQEHCRISPPLFLAECRLRRLNQASFVLLCFVLFAFSGLCLVLVMSVFDLSSVLYIPAYTDVNIALHRGTAAAAPPPSGLATLPSVGAVP